MLRCIYTNAICIFMLQYTIAAHQSASSLMWNGLVVFKDKTATDLLCD